MTEQTKPLREQSPSEIDLQLEALYLKEQKALNVYGSARQDIHYKAGDRKIYLARGTKWGLSFAAALTKVKDLTRSEQSWTSREAQEVLDRLDAAALVLHDIRKEAEVFDAEFDRRGGWTRAFLALSSNGHVHNERNCSTCNNGEEPTLFGWFPQYSGKPEAEIVEDAGERACTVCYPSAPVSVLNRPTKFFSAEEVDKAAKREEREAKRAKAAAEKITVEDIAEYSERGWTKEFKTLRAATQFATSARADVLTWGGNHPSVPRWESNAAKVEAAIAAKTGRSVDEVTAEIKAKAVLTHKRRG